MKYIDLLNSNTDNQEILTLMEIIANVIAVSDSYNFTDIYLTGCTDNINFPATLTAKYNSIINNIETNLSITTTTNSNFYTFYITLNIDTFHLSSLDALSKDPDRYKIFNNLRNVNQATFKLSLSKYGIIVGNKLNTPNTKLEAQDLLLDSLDRTIHTLDNVLSELSTINTNEEYDTTKNTQLIYYINQYIPTINSLLSNRQQVSIFIPKTNIMSSALELKSPSEAIKIDHFDSLKDKIINISFNTLHMLNETKHIQLDENTYLTLQDKANDNNRCDNEAKDRCDNEVYIHFTEPRYLGICGTYLSNPLSSYKLGHLNNESDNLHLSLITQRVKDYKDNIIIHITQESYEQRKLINSLIY